MASVLAVGVATLDLIQVVDRYPNVDSELRAQQQTLCRGGNATNTLTVLSQLGHRCSWLGTLADDVFANIVRADLDKHNIDYSYCPRIYDSVTPTSHVLLSKKTFSRNIIHYRSLRELLKTDYQGIDFSQWDWLHFEGRNIPETLAMMRYIKNQYPAIIISLEIEKPREDIEQLFGYADHYLFSRYYANSHHYDSAEIFLNDIQKKIKGNPNIVCAWGEQGAMCLSSKTGYIDVPALSIDAVDTRAAGDVFNAAYIDACLNGESFLKSVEQACYLAGKKCAQSGIDNLTLN